MQLKANFPRDGSTETPPHPSADFQWKDYCPTAFGKLREVFHIEAAEYMESICGAHSHHYSMHALGLGRIHQCKELWKLSHTSGSKSGSVAWRR